MNKMAKLKKKTKLYTRPNVGIMIRQKWDDWAPYKTKRKKYWLLFGICYCLYKIVPSWYGCAWTMAMNYEVSVPHRIRLQY